MSCSATPFPAGLTVTDDLDAALTSLEVELLRRTRLLDHRDIADVAADAEPDPPSRCRPWSSRRPPARSAVHPSLYAVLLAGRPLPSSQRCSAPTRPDRRRRSGRHDHPGGTGQDARRPGRRWPAQPHRGRGQPGASRARRRPRRRAGPAPPAPPPVQPAPPRRPHPPTPPRRPPSPRPPNPSRIGPDPSRSGCSAPSGSTSTAASPPGACAPKPPSCWPTCWCAGGTLSHCPDPRLAAPHLKWGGVRGRFPLAPEDLAHEVAGLGRRFGELITLAATPREDTGCRTSTAAFFPEMLGSFLAFFAAHSHAGQGAAAWARRTHQEFVRQGIVHSLSIDTVPPARERRRHWRDGLRRGARFADHPPKVPAGRLQRLLDQATVAVGEPRIVL